MADNNNVEIKITTTANTQGAEKTAQALTGVKAAAEKASTSSVVLTDATNKTGQAMSSSAAAQNAAASASSGLAINLGKAFGGFKMLLNIIPGLGMAGAIGLAVEGVSRLAQVFLDSGGKVEGFSGNLARLKQSISDIKTENARFNAEMASIRDSVRTAKEQLEAYYKVIDSRKSDQMRLLDKQKELDLAKMGAIRDPVKKAQAEYGIESKYIDDKAKIEKQAIQARENVTITQYNAAQREQIDLKKQKKDAQGLLSNATAAEKSYKTQVDDADKAAKKARAEADLGFVADAYGGPGGGVDQQKYIADTLVKREEEAKRLEKIAKDMAAAKQLNKNLIEKLQTRIKKLNERIDTNTQFIDNTDKTRGESAEKTKNEIRIIDQVQSMDQEVLRTKTGNEINQINEKDKQRQEKEKATETRKTQGDLNKNFTEWMGRGGHGIAINTSARGADAEEAKARAEFLAAVTALAEGMVKNRSSGAVDYKGATARIKVLDSQARKNPDR